MSMCEEVLTVAFVVEIAAATVDAHGHGLPCQACTDGGCEQLTWARRELAEHRARRAQTTPTGDRPNPTAGEQRRTA